MPPWKPEPGFGDFKGSRRLTDGEIQIINHWVESGAAQGDPAALPPVPHWAPGWQLGSPDLVVRLPEYTLAADGVDVFRNFVVSIPGTGMRYVRGLEFRAGSKAIHHANIRIDPTSASRRLDEADPEPGYEGLILNSAEYPDGYFLGWTPGQVIPLAPKGLAWRLTGGSDFVVQLHMRPTGRPERIQPAIGLFFTKDPPALAPAMLRLGRQNIDIPPGQADYRSRDSYTLPVDAQVQAIQPHSHYRAREVSAWAELPDGSKRSLIYISRWDFAWQDAYRYATPFWLPAGTRLFTEFLFDNSADNPQNPEVPPKRALWGFRSSDEMGDVWIQALTHDNSDRERLVGDFRRKADAEDIVGYETRIRADPAYAALHADVAVLYVELGQPEHAIPHFESVVRLQPGSAVARYNLGTALEGAGRFSDAAEQYTHAIDLDGSYAPARLNLGNMLLQAGRILDAQTQYREALRLAPANADAHNNLGRVLLTLGRRREAEAEISEALRLRPAYAEAHFNMAEILHDSGDPRHAVVHYRHALVIRKDWPPCLTRLSWILSTSPDATIRNSSEAIRLATRAVDVTRQSDAAALDALAAAYASAGRFDAAVSAASIAATLAAPNAEQATEILDRLALYRRHLPYVEKKR
jgi:Flp pilus assembly protein TadD